MPLNVQIRVCRDKEVEMLHHIVLWNSNTGFCCQLEWIEFDGPKSLVQTCWACVLLKPQIPKGKCVHILPLCSGIKREKNITHAGKGTQYRPVDKTDSLTDFLQRLQPPQIKPSNLYNSAAFAFLVFLNHFQTSHMITSSPQVTPHVLFGVSLLCQDCMMNSWDLRFGYQRPTTQMTSSEEGPEGRRPGSDKRKLLCAVFMSWHEREMSVVESVMEKPELVDFSHSKTSLF